MESNPKIILLFSGKRKSGKDFITDALFDRLNSNNAVIIKISGPIKSYWAQCNNLHLNDLLSDSLYKEKHRKQMIKWSEEQRETDYGVFCRKAVELYRGSEKSVWIVSDVRRKTDILWFKETYSIEKIKTIRINASKEKRKERGWIFTLGIDDQPSECDLDDVNNWDWIFNNDGDASTLEQFLVDITEFINKI
ncbi:hypothetical protein PGB90_006351 [Kerria lacca]